MNNTGGQLGAMIYCMYNQKSNIYYIADHLWMLFSGATFIMNAHNCYIHGCYLTLIITSIRKIL